MGRIRTLKPEFFRSRSLAKCSRDARLTFQGLWCEADDFGRGIADPRILKGTLWPLDDEVTPEVVDTHLHDLACTGHIELYEVDGDRFYAVVAWEIHQAAAYRRGHAVYPEPLRENACTEMQDAPPVVQMRAGTRNEERGTGSEEGAPNGASRGSRIPETFVVNEEMAEWAAEDCPLVNLRRETDRFVDWAKSASGKNAVKRDWPRAWKNWLRSEQTKLEERGQRGPARTYL